MKIKKITTVLLAGAMLAFTAGCSSTPVETEQAQQGPSAAELKRAAAERARMQAQQEIDAARQAVLQESAERLAQIKAANRHVWEKSLNK
jgi:hypothetical protein